MERGRNAISALLYPVFFMVLSCSGFKPRVFSTGEAGADGGASADGGAEADAGADASAHADAGADAGADFDAGNDAGIDAGADGGAPPASACDAGATRPLGCACSSPSECLTGNCVNSTCCDTAPSVCYGCRACNVSGSVGTCTNVPRDQDPNNACVYGSQWCQAGGCAGDGGCLPADAGIVCGDSCFNNAGVGQWQSTTYRPGICDGIAASTCPTTASQCLEGRTCGVDGGCITVCAKDADCIQGYLCNGATCELRRANTVTCSRDGECESNVCTGSGANRTCQECSANRDCTPARPDCQGGNCRTCYLAFGTPCEDAGFGSCTNIGFTVETVCGCGTCTNARAPRCQAGNGGNPSRCVCGSTGSQCPRDAGTICTEDGNNGVCKIAPGNPCVNASDCASDRCDGGACDKLGQGWLCRYNSDCTSSACDGGRCQ